MWRSLIDRAKQTPLFVVTVLYLFGMMFGTLALFTNTTPTVGFYAGAALALAVELHSWLVQTSWRKATAKLLKMKEYDGEVYKATKREQRKHFWSLVAIVTFSVFNGIRFWLTVMHPTDVGGVLVWGLVGAVVPFLFLLLGNLHKIEVDEGDALRSAYQRTLNRVVKGIVRQTEERLDQAERDGHDLAPLAVKLFEYFGMTDAQELVNMVSEGLRKTESVVMPSAKSRFRAVSTKTYTVQVPNISSATGTGVNPSNEPLFEHPTGPVLPVNMHNPVVSRLTSARPGRMPRRTIKMSPRERVVKYLSEHPEASNAEVVKGAKVSPNTVRKYRDEVTIEA